MNLKGKTAVVTGGNRGIGRAYSERLAAAGANLVVIDIQPNDTLQPLPGAGERREILADVGDPDQVWGASMAVLEQFGCCDILVNNAAVMPITTLDTVSSKIWRQVQAVNVEALVHFAQLFSPGMAAAGWGRIVATGSAVTLHPQTRDLAYITSKAAVHGLVKALANELGGQGITVNAIAPTVVKTPGFADRLPKGGATADDMMDRIIAQQTLQRACVPQDVAGALAWLVSDDASFVTGQIIHVDGGRTRSGA
jgi:NAD(P)-dependent dehydrogenase (short-subunit alcohol dehydrogenase family)